ncbi:MAG: rRNA maturation RNase YbeY [Gammaproteobacteria bacterium]|nr:MAG: rRNA maturation RNase YbeY [Gammaproteobacteria bacterium]
MAATVVVDVQIEADATSVPADEEIRDCLAATLRRARPDVAGQVEMAVRVVDEEEGRALNRQFRNQDKATNVLAFPVAADTLPEHEPQPLGDIVLCGPLVEREAAEQGKAAASHWQHLLVHGALHLLGFDHDTDAAAAAMESLECEILAQRGIADPYRGQ